MGGGVEHNCCTTVCDEPVFAALMALMFRSRPFQRWHHAPAPLLVRRTHPDSASSTPPRVGTERTHVHDGHNERRQRWTLHRLETAQDKHT